MCAFLRKNKANAFLTQHYCGSSAVWPLGNKLTQSLPSGYQVLTINPSWSYSPRRDAVAHTLGSETVISFPSKRAYVFAALFL